MFSRVLGVFSYEVHLGGNHNDAIDIVSLRGGLVATTSYPGVLDCAEERAFWVAWKEGLIQVGRGVYPEYVLLEWQDPEPEGNVDQIQFQSWILGEDGRDAPATWRFAKVPGRRALFIIRRVVKVVVLR